MSEIDTSSVSSMVEGILASEEKADQTQTTPEASTETKPAEPSVEAQTEQPQELVS